MQKSRWRKVALLASAVAVLGAVVVPGALAQTTEPVIVRAEDGVLRLHLGSEDYFRLDTPDGSGGYVAGAPQSIVGSCPVTAVGTEGQPHWATLVGGKIGSSFSLSQIGLKNDGLGIKYLNCGRVDSPSWQVRLGLGSASDLDPDAPEVPAVDYAIDYAEIDLEGFGGVTVVANLMLHGTTVATLEQPISGSGTNVRLVIGTYDDPSRTNVLFDEIRLRPKKLLTSVSLEGGAEGSAPRGSLGTALGTDDSLFRVVSETPYTPYEDALACGATLSETGAGIGATLSRPDAASNCEQDAPVTLIAREGEVELLKDPSVVTQLELVVEWAPEPASNPLPATEIDYGDGSHVMQWCLADGAGGGDPDGFPDLPDRVDPEHEGETEFWCITSQGSVLNESTGYVQVTEDYFGFGDPKIFR